MKLKGFLTKKEKELSWKKNFPLQISLAFSRQCNAQCIYCYTRQYIPKGKELSLNNIEYVLSEGQRMGVKTLILPGYGEPILHPNFIEILKLSRKFGLWTVVFTNATLINRQIAERLSDFPVSLVVKLNSFKKRKQDFLAGRRGFAHLQQRGIKNLLNTGFNRSMADGYTRMSVDTLITKMTSNDVIEIVRWGIDNNVFPIVETLLYRGRAVDNMDILGSPEEMRTINTRVLSEVEKMMPGYFGFACDMETYSLFMEETGHIVRCFSRRHVLGKFPEESLHRIWKSTKKERIRRILEIRSCNCCEECPGRKEALRAL